MKTDEEKLGLIRESIFEMLDHCYISDHLRNQTFKDGTMNLKDPDGVRTMVINTVKKGTGLEIANEVFDNVLSRWQEQRKEKTPNMVLIELAFERVVRKEMNQCVNQIVEKVYGNQC